MSDLYIADHRRPVTRWLPDSACVTWCSGLDVEQVAHCFGAEPESATPMTLLDAEMEHYDEAWQTVLVGSLDGWTLAIEPNGGEARSTGVLTALSTAGRAFGLYWNGPVHTEFNYAAQGCFIAAVPRSPVTEWPAAIQGVVAPHIAGLPFPTTPDDQWLNSAFALATRLSDTHMTVRWLHTEHSRFVISTEICTLADISPADVTPR
ncbi:DUF6461 domain-containing protein [Spongiactinospora sp. TRM90649]|uniref:DUF6461 domain-containing protein n=1 Tax=Spongiactinospora sp. TRM90649 TaxID=3031114 RepID=UPI0023F70C7C|nr:DUF6461 domain-containing protein [Spongiactinospora sp. TRM90649]MDF5755675.1 DUF6461 domain-containing protein [Spongiactinospora sp. TRM90649]